MLRARRETKNETKALFRQYFCELEALRAENDRLRAENEELRRGQFF
jgi:cell division protein FtsB